MLAEDVILTIVLATVLLGIFLWYDLKVRKGKARWEDLERAVLPPEKGGEGPDGRISQRGDREGAGEDRVLRDAT